MADRSAVTGDEPLLGGAGGVDLSGREPGLGGERRVMADPRLLAALLDDRLPDWQQAITSVLDMGQQRIYALELVKILASSSRRERGGYSDAQRIAATRALEAFGHAAAVQALVDVLGDTAWWVGQYAVDALIAIGRPAVEPVMVALRSPNGIARRRAANILGAVGDSRAAEPLADMLAGDPFAWVRACAAQGLGGLRASSSVPVLVAALRTDPDRLVRQYAREALVRLGAPAPAQPRELA